MVHNVVAKRAFRIAREGRLASVRAGCSIREGAAASIGRPQSTYNRAAQHGFYPMRCVGEFYREVLAGPMQVTMKSRAPFRAPTHVIHRAFDGYVGSSSCPVVSPEFAQTKPSIILVITYRAVLDRLRHPKGAGCLHCSRSNCRSTRCGSRHKSYRHSAGRRRVEHGQHPWKPISRSCRRWPERAGRTRRIPMCQAAKR